MPAMKNLASEALLLLTAMIWGFAFVAQRQGMESLDPLLFNGLRFSLGAVIVGLLAVSKTRTQAKMPFPWLLAITLTIATSLQQIGMVWTTAGNAGFITGLYVVFVPIIGIFRKQLICKTVWIAVVLAVLGLYLINVKQDINVSLGNLFVLFSAVFFAWHVQLVDKYTKMYDTLSLAFAQVSFCALGSLALGIVYNLIQKPDFMFTAHIYQAIGKALVPILYAGLMSVGVAYTLQVYAQKKVAPSAAAIILCLESVFALLGGWLVLQEKLTLPILSGAGLLFIAMLLSIRSR
jgi:drug/metabolite transporter (DMT)-like permease